MNAFQRSWTLTKLSFSVLNKDRELIWFAILSGVLSIIFSVSMIFPTVITKIMTQGYSEDSFQIFEYVMLFITYFGLAVITTFFNVCTVNTARVRFEGGNASFGDSIRFAFSKLGLIIQWSLVSATVGLILNLLDRLASRFGRVGQIIMQILVGLLGLAWSIMTIFVVPIMVYEGTGPIDTIKKSTQVIKKTWGESLIRHFGFGFILFLVMIPVILMHGILMVYFADSENIVGFFIVLGFLFTSIILIAITFQIAAKIYNTALYLYATKGEIPSGYSKEVLRDAFRRK